MVKYRVPVLEKFTFQPPVIDKDLTSPPGTPATGDRYIVAPGATGDWAGQDNNIAWWDGAAGQFDTATEGFMTWVKDEDLYYSFDGTSWSPAAEGDMLKSVYDTDNDGIVDNSERVVSIDDHNVNELADITSPGADIEDAVSKRHTQNTDQYLDYGGVNEISAAQAKEAYTRRAKWDPALECLTFEIA